MCVFLVFFFYFFLILGLFAVFACLLFKRTAKEGNKALNWIGTEGLKGHEGGEIIIYYMKIK